MALPEDFNPWEHLQDTVRRVFRKEVIEEFKDLGGDDWDRSIGAPRASLRTACTPDDNDTATMTMIRMMLFYIVLRRAQDMQAPIYGMPTALFDELFTYRPQVTLYFREDIQDVDPDFQPLRVQLSFRLVNETSTTISKAELTTLANKIKSEFGGKTAYRWHKGKVCCIYKEKEKGYYLKVFAFSINEGKEVISKVLDLQNHTPDWSNMAVSENEQTMSAFPTIPPTKTILGKPTRMPRKRPVGYVRFERASCQIYGQTKPVTLYDRTGRRFDALVT
jgi:hypothetical protein